jgi:hypothetical protein
MPVGIPLQPKPGGDGRSDPKPGGDGRSDPKPGGDGRTENLGSSGTTAATAGGSFAGGAGWVVVAFIGPAGTSVPDLACRILQGNNVPPAGTQRTGKLGNLVIAAQEKARQQQKARDAAARTKSQARPTAPAPASSTQTYSKRSTTRSKV